jgi:hypothetical protein
MAIQSQQSPIRVAYVAKLDLLHGSAGVRKKIASQLRCWSRSAVQTRLFVLSRSKPQADTQDVPMSSWEYAGLFSRFRESTRLADAVLEWQPDALYMRYSRYQPGYRRLMNRVPTVVEINSDDVAESRLLPRCAQYYNALSRRTVLGRAAGLVFVSEELAWSNSFRGFTAVREVIANGVELADFPEGPPPSPHTPARLVCVASPRVPWLGVEKIMTLATLRPCWHFDLVGWTSEQLPGPSPPNLVCHGVQPFDVYLTLLKQADVAVGNLALHRKSMNEGSELKTREYLAAGLPVILSVQDTDFVHGADFILQLPNVETNVVDSLDQIDAFVTRVRGHRVPREQVAHLDWQVKEPRRLAFIQRVISSI